MKNLIAVLALTVTAVTANADSVLPTEGLQTVYNVETINIHPKSYVLRHARHYASARVDIDYTNKILQLVIEREFYCPPSAICIQVMPAPVVITLPIVYIGSGFCGGTIITAEKDNRKVDGSLVSFQIVDDNGNICERTTETKPVHMVLTEQAARSEELIHSELTGVPATR